jgi:hypothetical protein
MAYSIGSMLYPIFTNNHYFPAAHIVLSDIYAFNSLKFIFPIYRAILYFSSLKNFTESNFFFLFFVSIINYSQKNYKSIY